MQIATITLMLGGDAGNTVQKFDVTPSEIAVLRVIHGDDAVTEIQPTSNVTRTNRAERQRLMERYGRNQPNGQFSAPAVDMLFPGVAARFYETFDELELDESFFKADTRVSSKPAKPDPLDHDGDGKKGGSLPAAPKSYSAMKKQELLDLAASRGVDVSESDKKDDIVAALQLADEAPAEAGAQTEDDEEDDGIGEIDDNLFK
ncbi:hypothetical protein [Rhizobium phaseoli]|uniref:hypothetical protein n=1 Tax=Rhizobium phaseoli TaxID=396 RepID=UPI00255269AA|nr:hypothetical protein [Rhizobium phaseoli]MDK4729341.1 hypothetical protein [Rhizobium phaseoli]